MSQESVELGRWRSAIESGEPVVLENEEIISLMRGESVEMDEGKGLGHLQQMFFTGKTTKSLPKVGKKAAKRFAKSAAKAAKEARENQFKVKTKGGGEETVSGEDLKAAGEVYDRKKQ